MDNRYLYLVISNGGIPRLFKTFEEASSWLERGNKNEESIYAISLAKPWESWERLAWKRK